MPFHSDIAPHADKFGLLAVVGVFLAAAAHKVLGALRPTR